MMIGNQVQKAILDALSAAPPAVGGRIYDAVPPGAAFPYVTIGDEQIIDDGNSCADAWDVFSTVHVWSRDVGHAPVKTLIAEVADRILAIDSIEDFSLIAVEAEMSRIFTDPDGVTTHGTVSFRFVTTS